MNNPNNPYRDFYNALKQTENNFKSFTPIKNPVYDSNERLNELIRINKEQFDKSEAQHKADRKADMKINIVIISIAALTLLVSTVSIILQFIM